MTIRYFGRVPAARPMTAVALALALGLAPLAAAATAETAIAPFAQGVAESAAGAEGVSAFYRDSAYAALWTTAAAAERRAALFAALDNAEAHGLPATRYDAAGLRARLAAVTTERDRARAEVAMSRAFVAYARDVTSGAVEPKKIDPMIVRDVHRPDPALLLADFAAAADPYAFLQSLPPQRPEYAQLMRARIALGRAAASNAWGPEVRASKLAPGDSGPAVVQLRDRLVAMGYLDRSASPGYDSALQSAVTAFQADHGLTADGTAGPGTIAEVNVGPAARMQSVTVALERLRWMHGTELGERHVWVNLPDFTAKIIDHGKVTFETVAVVGMNQSDRRTPEFSDEMEYMVVNPTWNVPRSITVKEYLPMMQKNPNAAGHLKLIDSRGRVVPRDQVNFAAYTDRTFPYAMKQPPSDGNALGLVKFMFPNQWNIYLHDTPSKSLFNKEVRAFSHGCIRLQQPFDFAYALLAPQTDDPVGLFEKHLKSRSESVVRLDQNVPVHLVYFTAFPDAKGKIDYRRDIYGRDAGIWKALQAAGS